MSFNLEEIKDEKVWEDFIKRVLPKSFLHSYKWGEFYKIQGSKIFRLGVFAHSTSSGQASGNLIGVGLLIKITAKRGSFLLCPHGPLFLESVNLKLSLKSFTEEAVKIAKSEDCSFVRVCSMLKDEPANQKLFQDLGYRLAPAHMHPELSWILDITPSEEELLLNMRKTTRYLIKKSEKDGIEVETSDKAEDIKKFWPVYAATAKRQGYTSFSEDFIKKEFELYVKDNQVLFFFGKINNEIISAAIIVFYGNSGFYHHSGSYQKDKINASYLLQWRVIQEAKKRGLNYYNFWGVSPEGKRHPWAGLSLFKRGFGGFEEAYLHAEDYIIDKRYWLNYIVEKLRSIKRGYQ